MRTLVGLRLSDANKIANENNRKLKLIFYSSLKGVENSDSDIVIRQRKIDDNEIELVISKFKTVV